MLDKLGGVWAPRPSTGPHKLRECMPLIILLRNRLKYALNTKEVKYILMQRLVKVDGKARTDKTYPAGFMGARLPPNACAPLLTGVGLRIARRAHRGRCGQSSQSRLPPPSLPPLRVACSPSFDDRSMAPAQT